MFEAFPFIKDSLITPFFLSKTPNPKGPCAIPNEVRKHAVIRHRQFSVHYLIMAEFI